MANDSSWGIGVMPGTFGNILQDIQSGNWTGALGDLLGGLSGYYSSGGGASNGVTGITGVSPIPPGVPGAEWQSGIPDPNSTARASITGNLQNLPQLSALLSGLNTYTAGQAGTAYNMYFPGYQNRMNSLSNLVASELSGQIPETDIAQMFQAIGPEGAAIKGIDPSSPASNAAVRRALGVTSMGLQQQGVSNMAAALGMVPKWQQQSAAPWLTDAEGMQAAYAAASANRAKAMNKAASQQGSGSGSGMKMPSMGSGGGGGGGNKKSPGTSGSSAPSATSSSAASQDFWQLDPSTGSGYSKDGNWYWDGENGVYIDTLTGDIYDQNGDVYDNVMFGDYSGAYNDAMGGFWDRAGTFYDDSGGMWGNDGSYYGDVWGPDDNSFYYDATSDYGGGYYGNDSSWYGDYGPWGSDYGFDSSFYDFDSGGFGWA